MQIEKDKVVSFHYQLSEVGGATLEETDRTEPAIYLHGHNNILPAMEKSFIGKEAGDRFRIELSPAEAYGQHQPDRQQRVPIKHLVQAKQKLRVGQIVQVNTEKGPFDARIIKLGKFNVDLDSNHPLAGISLAFDIEVVEVRQATEEEIDHKHAHGPGGHQH